MTAFRKVGERLVHADHYLRVVVAAMEAPDGEVHQRTVVHTRGAVGVVPLLFDCEGTPSVVLVRQYRAALGATMLEIPAGIRDVEGEPPEQTARRELVEEAGYTAGQVDLLTMFHNTAGWSDAHTYVFCAVGLEPVEPDRQGPEEQHMEVVHLPLAEAVGLVATGAITDAKTVIGLLLAERRLTT